VGSVNLSCRVIQDQPHTQKIAIEVADTGMGMDESFIQNLFEKFTQEYDSVTRRFGGTGLGMSICKELLSLMGGEIHVSSKKGFGTTVSILMDLEKGSEADLSSRDSAPVDTDNIRNKKVLVVDDNDMNRLVATTILGNYATIIFEAANGQEAVAFLRRQLVDIVLMDIQMPVMSGLEASMLIRKEISPTLPIIALTANAIRGENDKCLAAGMNDYLSKPFEEAALIKMISTLIARHPMQTGEAPAPPAAPLYDFHRLEAIGNQDFIKKMVRLFIDQMPGAIQELQAAAANKDLHKVYEKAHILKPILHNLSIDSLHDEIRELEASPLTAHPPRASISSSKPCRP
jgi:CheY-like chemotaxis protein/HPt (histidine-containing phosphotransfer) domain-containing protein